MEIYQFLINLDLKEYKERLYYDILGIITNFLGRDSYNNILSISPIFYLNNNYKIKISILGKNNFNKYINCFLDKKNNLNLKGIDIKVLGIDFNFNIYEERKIIPYNIKSIIIEFKSPTYIKKTLNNIDINYYLPTPEVFLLSIIRRYYKLRNIIFEGEEEYKLFLKNNFFISEFNILTKQIKIKGNIKAGVLGKIKYNITNKVYENNKFNIVIKSLELSNFIGVGTGTKLGLGQVKVSFN